MDIKVELKEKAEQVVKKLLADKTLMERFEKNPVSVIEEYVGVDLPDELVNQLVDVIKGKIQLEKAGDLLGGLGKLFGK